MSLFSLHTTDAHKLTRARTEPRFYQCRSLPLAKRDDGNHSDSSCSCSNNDLKPTSASGHASTMHTGMPSSTHSSSMSQSSPAFHQTAGLFPPSVPGKVGVSECARLSGGDTVGYHEHLGMPVLRDRGFTTGVGRLSNSGAPQLLAVASIQSSVEVPLLRT